MNRTENKEELTIRSLIEEILKEAKKLNNAGHGNATFTFR